MAGKEEVSMEATVKCTLKPFTAAKSADAVAGNDGLVMRKRKAVVGSRYEGWTDDFLGVDTTSSDPALIDETLHEAKLPAAAKQVVAVPRRMHRLSEAEIRTIIALKPGPLPHPDADADYLEALAGAFSPEYIEERKRQLEDEAELWKKMDEKSEVFRQQVIKSVCDKGYFEVDDEFLINREKVNQWALEEWENESADGLVFASDEEEDEEETELMYPPYVPDEDDAAVLDLLSEDEEDISD